MHRRLVLDGVILAIFAAAASVLGRVMPGEFAAFVGFVTGVLVVGFFFGRRPRSIQAAAPWEPDPEQVGLHLSVYQLRDGSWRPEYVHKVHMLAPPVAVKMLRQAAEAIEDDWDLSR